LLKNITVIAVRCSDQKKSVEFYEKVLGIPIRGELPQSNWIELGFSSTSTGIAPVEVSNANGSSPNTGPGSVSILLETDDIDKDYEELLDKGIVFTQPPDIEPWGGMMAHFLGPDGENLTLVQLPFR